MHFSKFAMSFSLIFCYFAKFYSHVTSYTPYAKAKATYKPFDANKAHVKTRVEAVQRSKTKKIK